MTPKRILLIEDDPDVRGACVEMLGSQAHTVVTVDDGAIALEEIRRRPPDVILLDLIMPTARMDGVTLLSRLAAGPRIPVIILSAFGHALAEQLSPEVAASLPITAILNKPFSFEALAREIDRVADERTESKGEPGAGDEPVDAML
jgi:two-component system, OmpR family, KDP operon response regulator KdpE